MKKTTALFLIIFTIAVSFSSCRTEVPTFENEPAFSESVRSVDEKTENAPRVAEEYGVGNLSDTKMSPAAAGAHCWGSHIYFRGTMTDDSGSYVTMLDYDTQTGEVRPACADSVCTHRAGSSCPFLAAAGKGDAESGIVNYFVDDGIIYYIARRVDQKGNVDMQGKQTALICSYDPSGAVYRVLGEWAPCANPFFTKYGDKLYFVQFDAHKEDEDYDIDLCSLDLSTESVKIEFRFRKDGESPYGGPIGMTEDGDFLFRKSTSNLFYGAYHNERIYHFYRISLKDGITVETVAENLTVQTNRASAGIWYENLYFTQYPVSDSADTSYRIEQIDLNTGKRTVVADNSTLGYCFSGKYLYYLPYEPQTVSVGEFPEMRCSSLGKVAQYNAETEETKIFTVSKDFWISGSLYMFVYMGKLYAPVYAAAEALYGKFDGLLGVLEIDLSGGTYRIVNGKVYG